MTRTVNVKLTGLARGGELLAVVTLSTIRPRCIEYSLAKVSIDVDGDAVTYEAVAMTDTSALTNMAQWLIAKFGATAASINREPGVRAAA